MKRRKNNICTKASWQFLALIGLCIFMAMSHSLYVLLSRQYPVWDENHYMSLAIGFYDLFHKNIQTIWSQIWTIGNLRQPLYGFILSLPLFLFGTEHAYKIALLTNGVFYIGSIVGVYFLAREFCSKTPSLLAATLYAWYGNVLFYLHYTYSETAVTTWIVWATVFLVRSKFFSLRRPTVYAGIMTACALLTRWIAVPFLLGQGIVCLTRAVFGFFQKPKQRKLLFTNLILFITVGVIIPIVVYYLPNFKPFSEYIWRNRQHGAEWVAQFKFTEMANPLSTRSLMFYFNIISQNTIFLFVPFIIGILVAFRYTKKYLYILAAFAAGYGFLTLFAIWKEDRFIVPVYPVMAILSVVLFDHMKNRLLRMVLMIIVAFCAALSFFGASWGFGPMGTRGLMDVVLPAAIKHPRRIYLTPLVWKPNPEYVNVHLVIDAIATDKKDKKKAVLLKTFTYEPIDNALNAIVTYEKRDLVSIVSSPIESSDYILTKDSPLPKSVKNCVLMETIFVPIDASTVYLYKNTK